MPLAASGDSSQSVMSLAMETPMAIRTPAHLYEDCASPSAAYYGESRGASLFGQDALVGPSSSSPFGFETSSSPPVLVEGEEQWFCGAPQSFSTFATPPTSAPQQQQQQQQQQMFPNSAALPIVLSTMVPTQQGGACFLQPVVEKPGLQAQVAQQQQQQQPGYLPQTGCGGDWAPVPVACDGGAENFSSAAGSILSQQQQQQEQLHGMLTELREKNRTAAGLGGAGPQQQVDSWQQQRQQEQFHEQLPLQNIMGAGGALNVHAENQQQQQQQQQTPEQEQQQQQQQQQQGQQNQQNNNNASNSNVSSGSSSVLVELWQEAASSVFLQRLLEAGSLVKDAERLTQQLDDRKQQGPRKQQRKLDPVTRARLEQTRESVRSQQEQLAWRLRELADSGNQGLQEEALRALLPRCWRTATDTVGRHVLEKFFEFGSAESRRRLVREGLHGGALRLAMHQNGCHVIQAALPRIPLEDAQEGLVQEFRGRVWELIESPNGNHVIQKVLMTLPAACVGFVVQECLPHAALLGKHAYGCRVLQRLLENYPLASEPMEALLEVLFQHFSELVTDSFGNYVLQHVLEYGRAQDQMRLIELLQPEVEQYATNRCASNLVEKALRLEEQLLEISGEQRTQLLRSGGLTVAILGQEEDTAAAPPVLAMAQDKYGNHIVQRMLSSQSPAPVRKFAAGRLRSQRHALLQGPGAKYAKHVLSALDALPDSTKPM